MKYTNKHGLPPLLARLLEVDEYVLDADYSATGLVSPPQLQVLRKRHDDEIVVDVAEEIWRFMGQAMHYVLSKTAGTDLLQEETIRINVNGAVIQMTPDLYQMSVRHLWDYKFTSVWSAIYGLKPEWDRQVNIYNLGLNMKGWVVDKANILTILRDWSLPESRMQLARGNTDYPIVQVRVIPVPLWPLTKTHQYVTERIEVHDQAALVTDEQLAIDFPCSDSERWATKNTYPVIRNGRAAPGTAKLETREGAEAWLAQKGKPGDEIVKRWGQQKRCEMYCPVAQFCHQYKAIKGET